MISRRYIRSKLLKECGPNYEKLWYLVFFDGTSIQAFRSRRYAKEALESMYHFTYNATQKLVVTNSMVFNTHSKLRLYTVVSGAEIVNYLYKRAGEEKGLKVYGPQR